MCICSRIKLLQNKRKCKNGYIIELELFLKSKNVKLPYYIGNNYFNHSAQIWLILCWGSLEDQNSGPFSTESVNLEMGMVKCS